MHRSATSRSECATAVRIAGVATLDLLLPAAAGECGEPAAAASAGPTVSGVSVLRQSPDGGYPGDESLTCAASDADSGNRSALSETELEPTGARPRGLPVPATGCLDRAAEPRLEYRYYIYSDAGRLSVPDCNHGLVQSFRAELGTVQHHGDRFLPGGVGKRAPLRPTRNLELRSGVAVHRGRVPGAVEAAPHRHQYGRARSRPGQCFHRAAVALAEVRVDLPRRLRQRSRTAAGGGSLLSLLQLSAPAPSTRIPHASRPVLATVNKEEGVFMMGGSAPQTPRDLALFRPEWMILFFANSRSCFTIGGLDRRIGQRRDATRAPSQARNGWRPSGRLLVSPLHHLRNVEILSKQPGPPQSG